MLIKTLSLTVLLLLSFNILAVEPCSAVPEGQQRRDGVCSHKDAALRARQVFSYILSLKKYCDEATREEINKWYLSNKKLINNAVIISKLPLKEIINNTDSTNLISESRQAWVNVAKNAATTYKEIEIVCSDKAEHRERVENRISDIPNLNLPSWHSVVSREYQPWLTVDITLDTAGKTPSQSQQALLSLLNSFTNPE